MMYLILIDPMGKGARAIAAVGSCNDDELKETVVELLLDNFEDPGSPKALVEARKWNVECEYGNRSKEGAFSKKAQTWIARVNAALCLDEGSDHARQIVLRSE